VGELRVKLSRHCVDIGGYGGDGKIATYFCDGFSD
jgi:hypothetical protein